MNKDIIISAPGKIILHGEHAVVYQKKALACSLDVRTYFKINTVNDGYVSISLPDISLEAKYCLQELEANFKLPLCDPTIPSGASEHELQSIKAFAKIPLDGEDTKQLAVVSFLYLFCSLSFQERHLPSVHIQISSCLPPSAGLGSSAAYSTCLAAGLLSYRSSITTPSQQNGSTASWSGKDLELVNSWAFESERILHGKPSGIDNAVTTHGGALVFQNGVIQHISMVPKLRILLVNTKIPRSTKHMVSNVRDKYTKYPTILGPVFESIEAISEQCIQTLADMVCEEKTSEDHFAMLKDLIEMNQKHLDFIGVSHPAIKTVCDIACNHGLRAKLTGAGGGGCVFMLVTPDTAQKNIEAVQTELSREGYDILETSVGGAGVLQHFSLDDPDFQIPAIFKACST